MSDVIGQNVQRCSFFTEISSGALSPAPFLCVICRILKIGGEVFYSPNLLPALG